MSKTEEKYASLKQQSHMPFIALFIFGESAGEKVVSKLWNTDCKLV